MRLASLEFAPTRKVCWCSLCCDASHIAIGTPPQRIRSLEVSPCHGWKDLVRAVELAFLTAAEALLTGLGTRGVVLIE